MTIGECIRALRQAQGLTQEMTATLVGITPTQLSRIELGQSLPRGLTLCHLATVFAVSLAELLAEADAYESLYMAGAIGDDGNRRKG